MRCTVIPLVKIVSRCRRLGNEALPQHIVRRVFKNFLSIKALRTVNVVGELGHIILNRVEGQKYGAPYISRGEKKRVHCESLAYLLHLARDRCRVHRYRGFITAFTQCREVYLNHANLLLTLKVA